ncbi:MAG: RDD family protein [Acidobacteriota bacterium]|nr:RDD family protein [Acidobacteriota bacterium]
MKCENCGTELVGAAIVCRHCNHNNAQGRVSQWRARRTGDLQQPPSGPLSSASGARSISPLPETPKLESPKPFSRNSKPLEPIKPAPIPFEPRIQINHAPPRPVVKSPSSDSLKAEAQSGDDQNPPWRAQLKEKVKQARDRKTSGALAFDTEPDEVDLDPNPIVESALRRIQWAKHTPSAITARRVARHGSSAAALARKEDFEPEPLTDPEPETLPKAESGQKAESGIESETEAKIEPKPAVRIAPTFNNPMLARKPTTAPVSRAETNPLPTRSAAKPGKTLKMPEAEARIAIQPDVKPIVTEASLATENKAAEPKTRVTIEIKTPAAPRPQPEKSVAAPVLSPRTPVATEVVGMPRTTGSLKSTRSHPAKLWVRTLAWACDFVVMEIAYLPLFYPYAMLNTSLGRESFTIMFFLLATLTFCYQFLMLTVAGRTTGMACLKLQIINVAGGDKPISITQKFARAIAATAAFLFPPLNLIVMQANHHRYSLPDLLSGTTLVEK